MNFIIHRQRQISPRFSKTREQIRQLARAHNIPRGRDILDTIHNLAKNGIRIS